MTRMDRRVKLALDESYRYYRLLEKNLEPPSLYQVVKALKTLRAALQFADNGHFKLTRQLWKRIYQALFDKLLTSFPGYVLVTDELGEQVQPREEFPENGMVELHPDNCRRADDVFTIEIKHLYPGTVNCLGKAWRQKGAKVTPEDFSAPECSNGICPMKPIVLGHEVLGEESFHGKNQAYQEWWELYWQAYCTKDREDKHLIERRMEELETVWGNLYY